MINSASISEVFVIEPLSITGGNPTLTACTTLFTNLVESCSGDTKIFMGTGIISFDGNLYTNNNLTATTINASTYFSGGTNLLNVINLINITGGTFDNSNDTLTLNKVDGSNINVTGFTDYYTTGTTLIGNTVYFDRNDALSAYTLDLSPFSANTYSTGITFTDNQIIITRNDNISLNTYINSFTGLTINGDFTVTGTSFFSDVHAVSIEANDASFNNLNVTAFTANTIYGNGSHITGLPYVTGGTPNNNLRVYTFTNSTGGTFNVTSLTDINITGGTYINGTATFTNNTGGTFTITGFTSSDTYITGFSYDNNVISLNQNQGQSALTITVNTMTGLTVNGLLSSTTVTTKNDIIVNGLTIGRGGGNLNSNTALGLEALISLTGGGQNVSVGTYSLDNLIYGTDNTVIGYESGVNLTNSNYTTSLGHTTLFSNITGGSNTAIGTASLYNTLGNNNTAIGVNSLYTTIGSSNIALGYYAGYHATTSNELYIDNRDRVSNSLEKTNSIIYGIMGSSASAQTLTFNANTNVNGLFSATTFYGNGIGLTNIPYSALTNVPIDVFVTGSTFINNSKILRLTRNDNVSLNTILPFRLLNNATADTTSSLTLIIDTISGITDNTNSFIVSHVTAYKDAIDYGFWKRTLAINKVSGNLTIIGENSDFDRLSSGMTANNIVYSANSGNVVIKISGETTKNYTWSSNWEIIS